MKLFVAGCGALMNRGGANGVAVEGMAWKVVGTGALIGAGTVVRDVGLKTNTVPPTVTGLIGEAVGATLVAGKTVGNTVWFVVTGVAVTGGLLGPVGNVQVDKFGRRRFAGTVTVEKGIDVAVAKGANAVAVTDGAIVP